MEKTSVPQMIVVAKVICPRYTGEDMSVPCRPISWDSRYKGIDVIETTTGEQLMLASSGGQSTPRVGWGLMLTGLERISDTQHGYSWTLYSIPKQNSSNMP